ncbi:UNVERIFIED_CONTAM: hypothetical protein K2H54_055866, partial [Gekko kuhli]
MKLMLRGRIISKASFLKKKKKKTAEKDILDKIKQLEHCHKATGSPRVLKQLNLERKALSMLEVSRIKKQLIFTKQNYWVKSPRSLNLLAHKVKEIKLSKQITALKSRMGETVTKTSDILKVLEDYYKELHTSVLVSKDTPHRHMDEFSVHTRLEDRHSLVMEDPITEKE